MRPWLATHWLAGAGFMAGALLLLAPPLGVDWRLALFLIYLHSPVYMIHQLEEHIGDRFRLYVNQHVFGGVEALTTAGVLWINLPGVWGVNAAAFYAAYYQGAGWGLAAPYLIIVNAIAHIATSVRMRGYNPGVVTAVLLFLPLGLTTLSIAGATALQHIVGLGISIAIHVAIIINTGLRAKRLQSSRA